MRREEVPDHLVRAAADVLQQTGLWGAWERQQTEDEVRKILAAVLPLHIADARAAAASQPQRLTVVVTPYLQQFRLWCREQNRSPYDRTIIRIADGSRDVHKLQGVRGDFDLIMLSEVPHHNEAMAMISHRLATASRKDPSQ